VYKIRYYQYHHKNHWNPGRGKNWVGSCTRDAVLVAGVSLNSQNNLSVQTLRHIDFVLEND